MMSLFLLTTLLFYINVIICIDLEIVKPKNYRKNKEIASRKAIYDEKALRITKYMQGHQVGHKAQYKEDLYLYENYFYGRVNGTIFESGAYDGNRLSTSYMFEKYFDWFPIHVEASHQHFELLKMNRPDALNIHSALCNETKLVHFLHRLNGSSVDGILEFMEKKFVTRFHKYWHRTHDPQLIKEMSCVTMPYLLQLLGITHLDIWVLDVEGAELPVLKAMEEVWEKITIDIVLLETMHRTDRSGEADLTIQIMNKYGYACHEYMSNVVCVHERFEPSVKPSVKITRQKKKPTYYYKNHYTNFMIEAKQQQVEQRLRDEEEKRQNALKRVKVKQQPKRL